MFDFSEKVFLVTGASGNLGSAVVNALQSTGASIAIPDRKVGRLSELFSELDQDQHLFAEGLDSTKPEDASEIVEAIVERFGRLDAVINTVGAYNAGTPLHEDNAAVWDKMLNINAKSVVTLSRAVLPIMIEQEGGCIITTSATAALKGTAKHYAYSASKAAVARVTESMAAEYKKYGIRVNAIMPGTMDTPQNRANMPKADFSKWVKLPDVANLILFLCSDSGRAVNGALIPVTGQQ